MHPLLKMEEVKEVKEKKEDNYQIKAIGKEMTKLIDLVEEKFEKEYGFRPSIIDITNLIAKRVIDKNIF